MIHFHTISLKAQEIFDPETGKPDSEFIRSPLDILVRKARSINFHEGDNATVFLTDGTCFEVLFENDGWICSHFTSIHSEYRTGPERNPKYARYEVLEDAITDVISKSNLASSVN